jgi:hypothetical protein
MVAVPSPVTSGHFFSKEIAMLKRLKEDPLASIRILRVFIAIGAVLLLALLIVPHRYKFWLIVVVLVVGCFGAIFDLFFIHRWQMQRLKEYGRRLSRRP